VVLGVLAEVAQRNSTLDLGRELGGELALQHFNLFHEPLHDLFWHWGLPESSCALSHLQRHRCCMEIPLYVSSYANRCSVGLGGLRGAGVLTLGRAGVYGMARIYLN